MSEFDFLYDRKEETTTRFVSFIGESMYRFDLAIVTTQNFYGKKLVIDMQSSRSAVIGPDDLAEDGYLAHVFKLTEEQANELYDFLIDVIGDVNFSDI
jgi:hypothetical protein